MNLSARDCRGLIHTKKPWQTNSCWKPVKRTSRKFFAKKGKDWEEELDQAANEAVKKLAAGIQQEGENNAK